jgi:hypothetical protein
VVQDLDATPSSRKDLGILVALSVNVDSSTLGYRHGDKFDVPLGAKAMVSDWKNDALTLKVAVELEAEDQLVRALFPERDLKQPDQVEQILKCRFVQVHARTNADIVVKRGSAGNKDLVIERLDPLISKYASATTQFNPTRKLDYFPYIFDAIARFNYYLSWCNGNDVLGEQVSMELFKLKRPLEGGAWVPNEEVGNLLDNNVARLSADKEASYGLTMFNHSSHDLFPYLFYFEDYSISVCCYESLLCDALTLSLGLLCSPLTHGGRTAAIPARPQSYRCHRWLRRRWWRSNQARAQPG